MVKMNKPRICAAIVNDDLEAIKEVEPLVDLFEVRIDLIGDGWQELVKQLKKPWIGCNRRVDEGGGWEGDEARRVEKLLEANELGADIIDLELRTENLKKVIQQVNRRAECLLSFHEMGGTSPFSSLKEIVQRQLAVGADICKVVTTARRPEDNLTVLQLIPEFPQTRVVALTMGPIGVLSRVLCPLIGGDFTYASIETGKEAAPGQITVRELRKLYEMVGAIRKN